MSELNRAYRLLKGYIEHEWDRIQSAERQSAEQELSGPAPYGPASKPEPVGPRSMDAQTARMVLGVSEHASMEEINKAYERLVKRSNPDNFPSGSPEQRFALDIQRRIHQAHALLLEQLSITERRFGTLEI